MDLEPYRVLGVAADATVEQIRQAYVDLARVWHPDRFQADPRLQQIAQDRLRDINAAYRTLKDRSRPEKPHRHDTEFCDPSETPPMHEARKTDNRAPSRPESAFRWSLNSFIRLSMDRTLRIPVGIAVGSLVLFLAALRIGPLLRTPVLDIDLLIVRTRITRPQILAPARILDPASDAKIAADALTEWARGEVLDLWSPAGAKPGLTVPPLAKRPDQNYLHNRYVNPGRSVAPTEILNGTELITTGRLSGVGELRLVNNTELEEVATLVRNGIQVRAIYVKPHREAYLKGIDTGVYDVHLALGTALDTRNLRFEKAGFAPDPVGPFEFFSVTTASGTTGQHYDVLVNPPRRPDGNMGRTP